MTDARDLSELNETRPQRSPTRLSAKARATRQRMIECAEALILEDGVEALSMERVAQRAEMSKGAVMYHFKTKRALLKALVESYAEHLETRLQEAEAAVSVAGESPDEQFIPAYIQWFRTFEVNNHGWADIGLALLALKVRDPELLEPVRAWYRKTFARVAAMPEDRRGVTLVAMMALEGFFYTHKFGLDLMSEKEKSHSLKLIATLAKSRLDATER